MGSVSDSRLLKILKTVVFEILRCFLYSVLLFRDGDWFTIQYWREPFYPHHGVEGVCPLIMGKTPRDDVNIIVMVKKLVIQARLHMLLTTSCSAICSIQVHSQSPDTGIYGNLPLFKFCLFKKGQFTLHASMVW